MEMDYDSVSNELLSLVDTSLKKAKAAYAGADVEIFLYYGNTANVRIEQGAVFAQAGSVVGNAARVAKGRSVGFASASGITPERIELTMREAHMIADKVSAKDERFRRFNDNNKHGREGALSNDILSLEIDQMIRDCQRIGDDASGYSEDIVSVRAESEASWSAHVVGNTLGVQAASRTGYCGCASYVTSKDGEHRKSGTAFDICRDRLYDTSNIGQRSAEDALEQHGARKLDMTKAMPTLWSPYSAATFIQASLGESVLGQAVLEKISPLCDRIGETIASSVLTLVDDGQNPQGIGTKAIDDEGHPQQVTPVIEKGVLKSFLFNTYTAGALGLEATGNCGRGRGPNPDRAPYESTVSVVASNLDVMSGSKGLDEIISSTDEKTILIRGFPIGIFHSSVATGEFSAMANHVMLVEKGEIVGPLHSVSVAGSFYQALKNIRLVGSDVEVTPFYVNVPSLLIDGLSVTG